MAHLERCNWVVVKSIPKSGLVGLVPVGFCSIIPARADFRQVIDP